MSKSLRIRHNRKKKAQTTHKTQPRAITKGRGGRAKREEGRRPQEGDQGFSQTLTPLEELQRRDMYILGNSSRRGAIFGTYGDSVLFRQVGRKGLRPYKDLFLALFEKAENVAIIRACPTLLP